MIFKILWAKWVLWKSNICSRHGIEKLSHSGPGGAWRTCSECDFETKKANTSRVNRALEVLGHK